MDVFLINLDRDKDRLAQFMLANSHLGNVFRPPAIEGRMLSREKLAEAGYIEADLSYNNACLGNAHSHIELWKKALGQKSPLTVAEDDAVFASNFKMGSQAIFDLLPSDWDIILWGWNFDAFLWVEVPEGVSKVKMQFDQGDLRANIDVFRKTVSSHVPIRLRHSFGIMAYSISPAGAKALLDICLPVRNCLISFDGFGVVIENKTLDAMMNLAYPKLKAYVCMPPLAISENIHEKSNTQLDP